MPEAETPHVDLAHAHTRVPMSDAFEFTEPDLFTVGTIGPPGERVFYLQAREGDQLVTLKCEKEQVRVLGEYLARLLERLATPAVSGARDLALVEPVNPAWIVGSIGVGYDEGSDRVVLVIEEVREEEDASEEAEDAEPREETEASPRPRPETEGEDRTRRARATVPRGASVYARPGGRVRRAGPGPRRGRPPHVPPLRPADEPRRAPLRPHQRARCRLVPAAS